VLAYDTGMSGWNEELTRLHEEETSGGTHFIDRASRGRAMAALCRHLKPAGRPIVLEMGVSDGHLLRELQDQMPTVDIVGADYTRGTLDDIAPRFEGVPLVQIDLADSPFPSDSFDAIVLLNVLEHIERDDLAVAHCFRMLKPGGIAVIEVPAGPELYDQYDRELMHFRRYRRRQLTALLADAGFVVEDASHIGFLLYPPFWLAKRRGRRAEDVPAGGRVRQEIQRTSRFAALGGIVMEVEGWLAERLALPIGIRCTAVGRKR